MLRNLKLAISYDGTDFHGWQVQPGLPTIQGALATAFARLTGEQVLPQGSGRTDAGVHAIAQVASCAIASPIPVENLANGLNDLLPASVRVLKVESAAPEFHARKSARAKTYHYRVLRSPVCSPFLARYVYHNPFPLDEDAIMDAAGAVVGEHDFASFATVDRERRDDEEPSNVRTVYSSRWQKCGDELIYTVRGNGFLHHMVRNLVGTFLLVGKGRLEAVRVRSILNARDRSANPGATAPACGLYLVGVDY